MSLSVLIFLLCCFHSLFGGPVNTLCSNGKSEDQCLCKRFTDRSTSLPSLVADCTGLFFNTFPGIQQFPDDITDLDLSINNIETLDPSATNISSLTLQKLILSYNVINYVSVKFFENLPELNLLDLSHNNISTLEDGNIFLKQKKLWYLDLSYNYIKKLPEAIFDPLPLNYLDLSYNPLGEFFMSTNDILSRTLGIGVNITHLKFNNIGLNDLHPDYFGAYKSLKHLQLADNNFTLIPSMPYSLEYLDFSGNNLKFVSAKYLNYHLLKYLRLSRMPNLTSIHHYAFYNLASLETLVITDCPNVNNFTELAFGLASKTTEIHPTTLSLARNGITTLNYTYQHMFRSMQHIDLRHNPWDCTCDILWLQEFDLELYKGNEIRCASPRSLRNRNILELTHLDLPQCYPEIYGKTSHRILIIILMTTVIFLVGFIFYLIRYPKSWVNPKSINIGPNSPYSVASQEERQ